MLVALASCGLTPWKPCRYACSTGMMWSDTVEAMTLCL